MRALGSDEPVTGWKIVKNEKCREGVKSGREGDDREGVSGEEPKEW
jgi:hypothetical protein